MPDMLANRPDPRAQALGRALLMLLLSQHPGFASRPGMRGEQLMGQPASSGSEHPVMQQLKAYMLGVVHGAQHALQQTVSGANRAFAPVRRAAGSAADWLEDAAARPDLAIDSLSKALKEAWSRMFPSDAQYPFDPQTGYGKNMPQQDQDTIHKVWDPKTGFHAPR